MGDRCYTRFSVPLRALSTVTRRRALAAAWSMPLTELAAVCRQDPAINQLTAGYDNGAALRFVEGVACVVWEQDECNYGGSYVEEALQTAGIPFLRFHLSGGTYGPGRAAFTGRGQMEWTDCDSDANPLIRADVVNGAAVFDPNAVAAVNRLLAAERAVLRNAKRRPRHQPRTKATS
jgi:hypothetical protein